VAPTYRSRVHSGALSQQVFLLRSSFAPPPLFVSDAVPVVSMTSNF
jgi:hypothetical protein